MQSNNWDEIVSTFDKGDYKGAIKKVKSYIKMYGESTPANILLAKSYTKNSDFDKAIKLFNKVISIEPNQREAWFYRGIAYGVKRKKVESIQSLRKALEADPEYKEALNLLGIQSSENGDNEEAEKYFLKLVGIDPNYKQGWYNMGLYYFKMKDYIKAQEAYEHAISIDPNFKQAIYNLAGLYCIMVKEMEFNELVTKLEVIDKKMAKQIVDACKKQKKKHFKS